MASRSDLFRVLAIPLSFLEKRLFAANLGYFSVHLTERQSPLRVSSLASLVSVIRSAFMPTYRLYGKPYFPVQRGKFLNQRLISASLGHGQWCLDRECNQDVGAYQCPDAPPLCTYFRLYNNS